MQPLQPRTRDRRVILWVVVGGASLLATVAAVVVVYTLYVRKVEPFKKQARVELEAYADARRRGIEPTQKTWDLTADRARADQILAQSTSLDVEVGNWRMGTSGDSVCFEGRALTPGGAEPLVVALARDDPFWRVAHIVSRDGCECSSDDDRLVDCPTGLRRR